MGKIIGPWLQRALEKTNYRPILVRFQTRGQHGDSIDYTPESLEYYQYTLDRAYVTLLVLFDLSAAFSAISRGILVSCL